ncbi:MAG: DinB family protein [Sphingobacteriales bacterium]|nr:DinB family protein [Sphingobacteriales bacterium]
MITQHLIQLFTRDLSKLREEINLYTEEEKLWEIKEGISNSAGNLCLHLCGNLQHFIGSVLGESGYIRNREAEFKLKNIARTKLLDEIDATLSVVTDTLEQVSKKDLEKEYPLHVFGEPMNTEFFLLHLAGHLNYHLGQINYHRRLI